MHYTLGPRVYEYQGYRIPRFFQFESWISFEKPLYVSPDFSNFDISNSPIFLRKFYSWVFTNIKCIQIILFNILRHVSDKRFDFRSAR